MDRRRKECDIATTTVLPIFIPNHRDRTEACPANTTKEPTKLSLHKNRWFTAAAFAIGISMLLLVK